jgi:Tol biopolymer transport system component
VPRVAAAGFLLVAGLALGLSAQTSPPRGARDAAWSPDGRRLALSYLDRIWTVAPDGRSGKPLRGERAAVERDPAWSPDGKSIAFAADTGDGSTSLLPPPMDRVRGR